MLALQCEELRVGAVRAAALAFVLLSLLVLSALGASTAAAQLEEEFDPLFDEYDEGYDEELDERAGFPDPLESSNRPVFTFNGQMDRYILDPITTGYGYVVPGPIKSSIRSVFSNLGEPATIVNDLIQLEWKDAAVATGRFVVNSTLGIAGLFDPAAAWMGLELHVSDFGQTLALAGTPSGAYVVVPVMGPTNVRDGLGVVADLGMHPATWFIGPANFLFYGIYTGRGISLREQHVEEMKGLRDSSVDYYSALANAFYQTRTAQIWDGREHRRDDWTVPETALPEELADKR